MIMKTDELGIPRFSNKDLINMIYSGNVEKCHVVLCEPSDDVDKFNVAMEEQGFDKLQQYIPLDVDQKTFDGVCQSEWFMPDNIKIWTFIAILNRGAELPKKCKEWIKNMKNLKNVVWRTYCVIWFTS